jgi:serine/threonine protein phosphatase PrpC
MLQPCSGQEVASKEERKTMRTLLLSLALVMIGLIILIAVLTLVHPAFRNVRKKRLREWIQGSASIEVSKIEIKRGQREQQQSLTKPQAAPTMKKAAASNGQRFSHLHCPRCKCLVPTGASFCFQCGALLDASGTGKQPPLNKPSSSAKGTPTAPAGNPAATKPAPSSVPVTLQPSSMSTTRDEPTVQLTAGQTEGGQTEEMPIVSSSQVQPLSGRHLNMAVGSLSHPGIKRQHKPNEDSLFAAQGMQLQNSQPQFVGLFIVADGMGGHMFGQEASRLSIQTMIDWILPRVFGCRELSKADFKQLLADGVRAANQVIYQQNMAHCTEMGTTITAALIVDKLAFVANVGDSRTYLYRDVAGLRKITTDHSVVGYLVANGIIQPDDIYIHPQRNQLYRSLGMEKKVAVDLFTEQLQPGDTLLLCSDGLWEMVRDPTIQQILQHGTEPSKMGHTLFEAALQGGGADNISVIVVHITQTTRPQNAIGIQLLAKPETVEMPNMLPGEPGQ